MENVSWNKTDNALVLSLRGHIDSANAAAVEAEIARIREENAADSIVIDCGDLEYISSAGLRILLRLKKAAADMHVENVSAEIYEIFEMTGFTEMMEIRKAYRTLNVEGCEVIGQGANGKVYRIDPDTIVKVYYNPDSLPEIQRERELARAAFVLGIPTAIPYDVVRIESGGYGSVFELLNAKSLAQLIAGGMSVDEAAGISVELLRQIHATVVKPGTMPDMKEIALGWADFLKDYLPAEQYQKLHELVAAVPADDHMLHGDYHLKNVMLQNGETLLIDMDTLCHGHPIFELASMYNAYVGFSLTNPQRSMAFLGIPQETCTALWRRSLELYLGTQDKQQVREVEDKARIIGLTRIMRREIRRDGLNREDGRKLIEACRAALSELLPRMETLVF